MIKAPFNTNTWFVLLISIAISALVFISLNFIYQKTGTRIVVAGFFPADTTLIISTLNDDNTVLPIDTIDIEGQGPLVTQLVGTNVINLPINRIQLNFQKKIPAKPEHQTKNKISIHYINIPKPYNEDVYIIAPRLKLYFESNEFIVDKSDLFQYQQTNKQIQLRSIKDIHKPNWWFTLGLSLMFGIASWLIIRNSKWSQIPAFRDMSLGNHISSESEFDTINGIRGLAAILVLFSHSAPGFHAVQMGVALLFVISGFLLSKPFVMNPDKIFNLNNIERYLTKRLKRILPMYYLYIFLTYVLTFQFDLAIRHFLFIQASSHLWPMTQIFAFYMLLPLVLLLTCWLHKRHLLMPFMILGVSIVGWIFWIGNTPVYYNGEYSHPFFLYSFLMGVLAAYLQYGILARQTNWFSKRTTYHWAIAIIALTVTVLSIAWSAPLKPPSMIEPWISLFYIKSILATLIILLAVNSTDTWFNHLISNRLFRSVGVVGFSFYLLHALGIELVTKVQTDFLYLSDVSTRSWLFTLASFIVTYLLAVIAYSYVERPFFGYREQTHGSKER